MLRHSGPLQFHRLSVGQCWGRPLLPAGPRSRGRQPGDCRFPPCCSSVPASASEHQLIQGVLCFLCVTAYRALPHTDELLRIWFLAQPLYIYNVSCDRFFFLYFFFTVVVRVVAPSYSLTGVPARERVSSKFVCPGCGVR